MKPKYENKTIPENVKRLMLGMGERHCRGVFVAHAYDLGFIGALPLDRFLLI